MAEINRGIGAAAQGAKEAGRKVVEAAQNAGRAVVEKIKSVGPREGGFLNRIRSARQEGGGKVAEPRELLQEIAKPAAPVVESPTAVLPKPTEALVPYSPRETSRPQINREPKATGHQRTIEQPRKLPQADMVPVNGLPNTGSRGETPASQMVINGTYKELKPSQPDTAKPLTPVDTKIVDATWREVPAEPSTALVEVKKPLTVRAEYPGGSRDQTGQKPDVINAEWKDVTPRQSNVDTNRPPVEVTSVVKNSELTSVKDQEQRSDRFRRLAKSSARKLGKAGIWALVIAGIAANVAKATAGEVKKAYLIQEGAEATDAGRNQIGGAVIGAGIAESNRSETTVTQTTTEQPTAVTQALNEAPQQPQPAAEQQQKLEPNVLSLPAARVEGPKPVAALRPGNGARLALPPAPDNIVQLSQNQSAKAPVTTERSGAMPQAA